METSARLLVVDDEMGIREACKRALTSEGYAVDLAEDGNFGLAKIKEGSYDLILMDLMMPGIGGLDLIKKAIEIDPEVIVVVITGYATIETAVEATKRGAYDYLPKPFTPEALSALVKRGLEKRALRLEAQKLHHEREQRLLELASEQSRLRTIVGCMADGVLVTNLERRLVLWNAAAVKMLKLAGTDEPGHPLDRYIKNASLIESVENILKSKDEAVSMVSRELSVEDPKSVLMAALAPVRDERGDLLGAVTVLRDITKLKEIEKIKSQFVSMVAHELRAPLAAIEGWLDLLISGEAQGDEKVERQWVERAKERSRSLLAMVGDLLEINKMDAGKVAQKIEPVRLDEVVRKIIDFFKPEADRRTISFAVDLGNDLPAVPADLRDMEKLFTNLISNAIKYNVDHGTVTVGVSVDENYVGVHIQDSGIGIAEEDLPRIFDDFFRAQNEETHRIGGTGLGLTIAKKIVDSHLGHIEVTSRLNQGSAFSVYLPYMKRKTAGEKGDA